MACPMAQAITCLAASIPRTCGPFDFQEAYERLTGCHEGFIMASPKKLAMKRAAPFVPASRSAEVEFCTVHLQRHSGPVSQLQEFR